MIALGLHHLVLFALVACALPKATGMWSGMRNIALAAIAAPVIYLTIVVVDVATTPELPSRRSSPSSEIRHGSA